MNEPFDDRIRRALRDYHRPPEPPREEMWARIDQARRFRRPRPHRRASRWTVWRRRAIGLAAALVVGIGLGRLSVSHEPAGGAVADAGRTVGEPSTGVRRAERHAGLYQIAATEHLGQAEALLVLFRTAADGAPVDAEVVAWARNLLTTTRLLLDSPAADDPRLLGLLEDLELVLVQIVQLPGGGPDEREMVERGIDQRDVMPRLRALVPSGRDRVGA